MATRAPKRRLEGSQQCSPVPSPNVVSGAVDFSKPGPSGCKSRKRLRRNVMASKAVLKCENVGSDDEGSHAACKEENVEVEDGCGLSRTVREFLSAEFGKFAQDEEKFTFDILDVVRRAVAAEIEAMSEEDVSSLTRERAAKLVEAIHAEVVDRYSRGRRTIAQECYREMTSGMDQNYIEATKNFRTATSRTYTRLDKDIEEAVKKYTAGVKTQAGKQKFTFRMFTLQEFLRARRSVRDEISGMQNEATQEASSSSNSRRNRRSSVPARRPETMGQSAAYVANLESRDSWAYVVASSAQRYAVRLPARPGSISARLLVPVRASRNRNAGSGEQGQGSGGASNQEGGGEGGGETSEVTQSGQGAPQAGAEEPADEEHEFEEEAVGGADADRIFQNFGWVIGSPDEEEELEPDGDEDASADSGGVAGPSGAAESFSVVMSESDRRDIMLLRRNLFQ